MFQCEIIFGLLQYSFTSKAIANATSVQRRSVILIKNILHIHLIKKAQTDMFVSELPSNQEKMPYKIDI